MRTVFKVDYDDGKVRAKAGDDVPGTLPAHRVGVLRRARVIGIVDSLDHDADGRKGGSLPKARRRRTKQ